MNKNKVKNTEFWEILALLHFYPHKYFPLKLIISLNTHICGPPNSKFLSNSCPARPTEARILLKETGGEMAGGKSPRHPSALRHVLGTAFQQPPVARSRGGERGWACPSAAEIPLAPARCRVRKRCIGRTCGKRRMLRSQVFI